MILSPIRAPGEGARLFHNLQALEELPAEAIVPARIVLSVSNAERVREMIARPPEPTKEMKRLFADR